MRNCRCSLHWLLSLNPIGFRYFRNRSLGPVSKIQVYALVLGLLRQKNALECYLNTLRNLQNKSESVQQLEMTLATSLAQYGYMIDTWADDLTQEIAELELSSA